MLAIMDRVRDAARRHPLAVDVALAGLLAVVNLPAAAGTGTGVLGWLLFVAAHLPLAWRRRAPVTVFWTVFAVAVTVWAAAQADRAYPLVVIVVAVYAVARYRPWRWWGPSVAAVELTLAVAWWQGELPRADLVTLTAIVTATVLLAMTVATRQAYIEQLQERAHRLARDRDQQARLAAAAERARIAREMHDIVAHNLAVMVALADGAALTATAAPQRAADTLATISATGRQALDEMPRLLGLLRDGEPAQRTPLALAPQPGLDDLEELVEQVRAAGMQVTLARQGSPGAWGPGAGLAVYRIVQEALTNTLKHAGARATARVRLCYLATGVELEVIDDGAHRLRRPPVDPAGSGHGLAGMIERAAAYGGDVEAGPLLGKGWRVFARLRFDGEGGT